MNARKPLIVIALLALIAALPPAPAPASSGPCTIYCNNSSNISCTSQVGDCAVLPGDARDFLWCDGKITPCPPYFPE